MRKGPVAARPMCLFGPGFEAAMGGRPCRLSERSGTQTQEGGFAAILADLSSFWLRADGSGPGTRETGIRLALVGDSDLEAPVSETLTPTGRMLELFVAARPVVSWEMALRTCLATKCLWTVRQPPSPAAWQRSSMCSEMAPAVPLCQINTGP